MRAPEAYSCSSATRFIPIGTNTSPNVSTPRRSEESSILASAEPSENRAFVSDRQLRRNPGLRDGETRQTSACWDFHLRKRGGRFKEKKIRGGRSPVPSATRPRRLSGGGCFARERRERDFRGPKDGETSYSSDPPAGPGDRYKEDQWPFAMVQTLV